MKKVLIAFVGLIVLTTASLRAQNCNENLDAGPDAAICQPGEVVNLNGVFSGSSPLSVAWAPAAGLSSPGALQTTATANATTTYTLTVRAAASQNLIFNGDFTLGDLGFYTDYSYGTGGPNGLLHNVGQYAISTNPRNTHQGFSPCGDHTTTAGNMLVVNGNTVRDTVWCQTVSVQPNAEYAFSAWVASVVAQNPANLQFYINGLPLGASFNASSTTCDWQRFFEIWPSGNAGTARICIVNLNTQLSGNDFALDDIGFSLVCEYQDSVTITVAEPPPPPAVSCSSTTGSVQVSWPAVAEAAGYDVSVLTGQAGTFVNDTTYLVDGLDPETTVDFEVTALSNGPCGNTSVDVSCSTAACPEVAVAIDGPQTICLGDEAVFTLDINTASMGPFSVTVDPGLLPFTLDGLEAGATDFSIAPPQSFTLSLTALVDNSAPNCVFANLPANLSVTVNQPADAGQDGQADACAGTAALFQLQDLLAGEDAGGVWTDISAVAAGGAFDPSAATVSPAQLAPGDYLFQYVVDSPAGCPPDSSQVEVEVLPLPSADAGQPRPIGCDGMAVTLGGPATSTGPEYRYLWEVLEGAALSDPASAAPEAQTPGIYALTVINEQTGCRAGDTVAVDEQVTFPELFLSASAGGCFAPGEAAISVDSVVNGTGPFLYSLDGQGYGPSPAFANLSVGSYTVYVIDANQCEGSAEIAIEAGTAPEPFLSASAGDCFAPGQAAISVDSVVNGTGPFLYSLDGEDYGPSPGFFNLSGGSYTVYVIDANQCAGSAEITIDAGAALDVQLVVRSNGGENTIAFGDSLLLEAVINRDSAEVDSISWFPAAPGCGNCRQPFVRPEQTTTYTVTVADTDGCRATATITVFVEQKFRYFIPNAFSPNEDGRNDVFFVYAGPEIRRVVTLRILDRWGNMVYNREDLPPNDPEFGWDGLFKGEPVPAGAYAFVVELELITGQVVVENGALTVVY